MSGTSKMSDILFLKQNKHQPNPNHLIFFNNNSFMIFDVAAVFI